ncbi:folylpolyglutamate synthase/dihydrofolate synthase family protein [Candidatus Nitronereus thalassa]|uniref:Dihydrofolate synthase/folylpolyglutamate synthase n=1 Tax=Candidatus Nitronereus thalassa TaxID=3020898 RepID=A0ABU3K6F2_9BACT|nr:folylpolyglutamate synthase/dihydrofolate synthase family protein [Candidatus Nitronereus thalassa]MDT7041930.1 bifunctional folylpolyglutamate synthase/dihydrofolate synthase [Candidatus Nitronereus thalassa]
MSESYHASLTYLYGLQKHGIKLGLDTIRTLLAQCDHPERKYSVLHIGGTNGKGSSAAMTAAILQAANIRVGLYTSPHLIDFRERIQVQGVKIPESRVVDLVQRFRVGSHSSCTPTFFETATAMAFQYFAEEEVEVAVLEVGMGGRFDATNVCDPSGVLITNVSYDHEAYLGHTLEAIAFEKAGIIKNGVPVVIGTMDESARDVISQKAKEQGAPLCEYGRDFTLNVQGEGVFEYQGPTQHFSGLSCALQGAHQLVNAACAVALLEKSVMASRVISREAIVRGLSSVSWEGRLETLMTNPTWVCDGAHNPAAARKLAHHLQGMIENVPSRKLIMIVAMMRDKNIAAFFAELLPLADVIICTQIDHFRLATGDELKDRLLTGSVPIHQASTPEKAVALAHRIANSHDLVCVTGSLYLVGAVKSVFSGSTYAPLVG